MSKNGKKAAADKKKATILVKVSWLGEKSALGMCERLQTDPAKNANRPNRVTRAVGDLPLALPFLEEKYSSYIQVRFKDKVFRGTVFNFFFTGKFNFKILNDFFLRSLLYTGPVPVYNYSQGQIVGAKDSKLAEKMLKEKNGEKSSYQNSWFQMAASFLASYWRQKTFVRGSSPHSLLFFCPL